MMYIWMNPIVAVVLRLFLKIKDMLILKSLFINKS